MSFPDDVIVRQATLDEARIISSWAQRESWQPGVGDADAFFAADPHAFFIAECDGELLGSISAARYGTEYAFVGHYVVDPRHRNESLGHVIVGAVAPTLEGLRIGIDGVEVQVPTYSSLGFELVHWISRHGGSPVAVLEALPSSTGCIVEALGDVGDDVIEFDAQHVPERRESFARAWYATGSPRRTFVVREEGRITGLATVRPVMGGGSRIGPLFASDDEVATALLRECASVAQEWDGDLFIDIPDPNDAARALATRCGLTPGFACARMYRGGVPQLPLASIYGNTSFELG